LAKKFVKVIKGPVEAQLIEDAKPDIPPPPPPPPPPQQKAPPPEYVPPVDVPVSATAGANAIAAVSTNAPPPVANVRTPAVINAAQNCQKPEYPSASRRNEEEGTVQLRFLIGTNGQVIESQVEKSSGFARLDEAARSALSKCQFKPGTLNGAPEQSWASMKYTWRLE
jgi:protein TonB